MVSLCSHFLHPFTQEESISSLVTSKMMSNAAIVRYLYKEAAKSRNCCEEVGCQTALLHLQLEVRCIAQGSSLHVKAKEVYGVRKVVNKGCKI